MRIPGHLKKRARELARRLDEQVYIVSARVTDYGGPAVATEEDLDTFFAGIDDSDILAIVQSSGEVETWI